MRFLCITHADFEGPGVIQNWAEEKGYGFEVLRPYKGEILPTVDSFDFLVIMGGPQSPMQVDQYPYIKDEIRLTRQGISAEKYVLGFCLGAQIIGEALGAKTEKSAEKEIGVYPLQLTKEAKEDPLLKAFPNQIPAIHWHHDMPGLTNDSVVLARSEGCERQVVRYASKVYGFQCHMEITPEGIEDLIEADSQNLYPSKYTQTVDELKRNDYGPINQNMLKILDRFVA